MASTERIPIPASSTNTEAARDGAFYFTILVPESLTTADCAIVSLLKIRNLSLGYGRDENSK